MAQTQNQVVAQRTDITTVTIIYNPNSTGPSKQLAEECADKLQSTLPHMNVRVIPTEYAGHAEELAYEKASKTSVPLIISSSGDGGYHEVVNGILRAQQEGRAAVAGLLPGGNANDHFTSLHDEDLVLQLKTGTVRTLDVLKLESSSNGKPFTRYAHSYIGVGLTPKVGKELTKTKLNPATELWVVVKSLFATGHTRLIVAGRKKSFRSLVFTNIGRMAKVLNLANTALPDDGRFEVSVIPKRSRLHMLVSLFHASTVGSKATTRTDNFEFRTIKPTLIQLDGEVLMLDADSGVRVSIEPRTLRCIV